MAKLYPQGPFFMAVLLAAASCNGFSDSSPRPSPFAADHGISAASFAVLPEDPGGAGTGLVLGDDEESKLEVLEAVAALKSSLGLKKAAGTVPHPMRAPAALSENETLVYEKARGAAGTSTLACAIVAAERVDDPAARADVLIEIAGKYIALGNIAQASSILAQAQEASGGVGDDWFLKLSLLVRIAAAQAEAGLFDRAFETAAGIQDTELKIAALTRIAVELKKHGEDALAGQTLSLCMDQAEKITEEFTFIRTMVGVFDELLRSGLDEEAMGIADQVQDDYFRSLMLEELAVDFVKLGRCDEALAMTGKMTLPVGKVQVLTAIASGLVGQGRKDEAAEVALKALDEAWSIQQERGRIWYLISVAGTLMALGKKERGEKLLADLTQKARGTKEWGKKVRLLAEIAGSYARGGEVGKASEILAGATEMATTNLRDDFQDMELLTLAVKHMQIRQYDLAVGILSTIEDPLVSDSARVQVAFGLMDRGMLSRAILVAGGIRDAAKRDYVLGEIIVDLVEDGQCDRAFELSRLIDGAPIQVRVLLAIAGEYAAAGDEYSASVALDGAAEKVRGIGPPHDRAEGVAAVASRYMAIGSYDQAIDLIRSSSLFEKAWVLKEIAAAYDAYMQASGRFVDVTLLSLVKGMKP